MKEILLETRTRLDKEHGVNMVTEMQRIVTEPYLFETYINGLAEGLDDPTKKQFLQLANNTRENLLENSIFGYNPYAVLVLPLLRKFWPRLSVKEAVTISPMNSPSAVRYFIRPYAKTYDDKSYELPEYNQNVSQGPQVPVTSTVAVPQIGYDLLGTLSLDPSVASVSRNFRIVKATDGVDSIDIAIENDIDGNFSGSVTYPTSGLTDVIQGSVDFRNGLVNLSVANPAAGTVSVDIYAIVSLEQNTINTSIEFKTEKILFEAQTRKLSAHWSVEFEQDTKALFNLDAQAELVSIMSNQIAVEIDKEILTELLSTVQFLHPTAIDTFNKNVPFGFALGEKAWYENIIPKMNDLSQTIYTDTNIAPANIVICNPLEASILESMNRYQYVGDGYSGTEHTYRVGTLEAGKWRIIVTPVMPAGKMLMMLKPAEERAAVYFYCPYIPVTIYPFPLGSMPAMTLMTRYAKAVVRPKGMALLNVVRV